MGEATLGVTVRYSKKLYGLAGRYQIEVETDFDILKGNAEYSSCAWKRVMYQQEHKNEKIDEVALNNLVAMMEL